MYSNSVNYPTVLYNIASIIGGENIAAVNLYVRDGPYTHLITTV